MDTILHSIQFWHLRRWIHRLKNYNKIFSNCLKVIHKNICINNQKLIQTSAKLSLKILIQSIKILNKKLERKDLILQMLKHYFFKIKPKNKRKIFCQALVLLQRINLNMKCMTKERFKEKMSFKHPNNNKGNQN